LKRVVVAGGSGFLGNALLQEFGVNGYEVVVLSRSGRPIDGAQTCLWDGASLGDWAEELEGAKAVVNLAGEPVTLKWTPANRRRIVDSRVHSTEVIGKAIVKCAAPPPVWVNSSAVGFYGDRGDEVLTEASASGTGFLTDTCREWEAAVTRYDTPSTRRVWLRTGVVLGKGGGALEPLLKLTKAFLGGAVGNGRQWVPWIHVEDLCRLFRWCVESPVEGPVNGSAPNPVTNAELMRTLRQVVGRPPTPPAPAFALRVVGALGGPDPSVLLGSMRAVPEVAEREGFQFRHSQLEGAVRALLAGD
jgi:hypothetical protein